MAGARSSSGLTVPAIIFAKYRTAKPEPDTTNGFALLGCSIGQEPGESSALGSKDVRNSKIPYLKSKSSGISKNHHSLESRRSLRGKEIASPDLNIPSQMKARYGKHSLELYNTTSLLPRTHSTLEDPGMADHHLEVKMVQTMLEKQEIQKRVHELEHQVSLLKDWSEKAEVALLQSRVEIRTLEQRCKDSYDAGRAVGRMELARDWQREDRMNSSRPGFFHHMN